MNDRKSPSREFALRWLIPEYSSVDQIHRLVVDAVGYDFRGRSNETKFVRPRQLAIWIMLRVTGASLGQIARFYVLHHTTVLYSARQIERQRAINSDCFHDSEALRDQALSLVQQTPTGATPGASTSASTSQSHPRTFGTKAS